MILCFFVSFLLLTEFSDYYILLKKTRTKIRGLKKKGEHVMLQTTEPLIFVSERKGESKTGNAYQFIKLANPKTYENYELFGEGVGVSGISSGDRVYCEFGLSSGFGKTSINVLSLDLAK